MSSLSRDKIVEMRFALDAVYGQADDLAEATMAEDERRTFEGFTPKRRSRQVRSHLARALHHLDRLLEHAELLEPKPEPQSPEEFIRKALDEGYRVEVFQHEGLFGKIVETVRISQNGRSCTAAFNDQGMAALADRMDCW